MADQVEVNVDAGTSSSVSHNSSFSFDADVSGTSSLDTYLFQCFKIIFDQHNCIKLKHNGVNVKHNR